jgi:Ni,Fe-hydrogenase III large subunit
VVLLELKRIYNHVADIGALATDVAFTAPASRGQALGEEPVRL